jgi:hypothetical protein
MKPFILEGEIVINPLPAGTPDTPEGVGKVQEAGGWNHTVCGKWLNGWSQDRSPIHLGQEGLVSIGVSHPTKGPRRLIGQRDTSGILFPSNLNKLAVATQAVAIICGVAEIIDPRG